MSQYYLGIDTSGQAGSICILDSETGNAVLTEYVAKKGHYEQISEQVRELFNRMNLHPDELRAICVCSGPGFYTGLRVGVAYAKGLAYALKTKISYVNTFHALLNGMADGRYYAAIEMGRGRSCVSLVEKTGCKTQSLSYWDVYIKNLPDIIDVSQCKKLVGKVFHEAGFPKEIVLARNTNAKDVVNVSLSNGKFVDPIVTEVRYGCLQ